MDTKQYKSIAVDYETWKTLLEVSEKECRSLSGQIQWMLRQYLRYEDKSRRGLLAPPPPINENAFEDIKQHLILNTKPPEQICGQKFPVETEWESRPLTQTWFRRKPTERSKIFYAMAEYAEPLTNTEIAELMGDSVERITKQTSGMFGRGLLKRRVSHSTSIGDTYQYLVQNKALRLYKICLDRKHKVRRMKMTNIEN